MNRISPPVVSRGFTYQGYQCQRCDCVVHRGCYNRFACPCKGKKYPEVKTVSFSRIRIVNQLFLVKNRRTTSFSTTTIFFQTNLL